MDKEFAAHVLEQAFLNADGHLAISNNYNEKDIVDALKLAVKTFREPIVCSLKKQQMMKNAVDGEINAYRHLFSPDLEYIADEMNLKAGDKVKLIIIKED